MKEKQQQDVDTGDLLIERPFFRKANYFWLGGDTGVASCPQRLALCFQPTDFFAEISLKIWKSDCYHLDWP
jgi:hypothetical protein